MSARGLQSNIAKMYVVNGAKNMMFFSSVAVPFFLDWAKIDFTRLFILEASFSLWMLVLEIPTGVIADKYGRKFSLALGELFSALSFFMFGMINNYWLFFLADFICAVGFTLLSGADKALLYDTLTAIGAESKASVYFSRYESAGIIGIVIGLVAGSHIAGMKSIGYPESLPLTFIMSGGVLLMVLIIALTINEPERSRTGEKLIRSGINGFRYIFKNSRLRGFSFNYTFISAVVFFMYWLYQPLLKSCGIGISFYGMVGAAFNLFSILLMMNVQRIEKIISINRLLFLSALIPGLLYAGLFFTSSIVYSLCAILLIVGLKQMRSPLLSDYINRHIASENRATVLSGISMLERSIIMILYPVIGLLADYSLSYAFMFLGGATIIFSFIAEIEVI